MTRIDHLLAHDGRGWRRAIDATATDNAASDAAAASAGHMSSPAPSPSDNVQGSHIRWDAGDNSFLHSAPTADTGRRRRSSWTIAAAAIALVLVAVGGVWTARTHADHASTATGGPHSCLHDFGVSRVRMTDRPPTVLTVRLTYMGSGACSVSALAPKTTLRGSNGQIINSGAKHFKTAETTETRPLPVTDGDSYTFQIKGFLL